jgi:hypothetical protein
MGQVNIWKKKEVAVRPTTRFAPGGRADAANLTRRTAATKPPQSPHPTPQESVPLPNGPQPFSRCQTGLRARAARVPATERACRSAEEPVQHDTAGSQPVASRPAVRPRVFLLPLRPQFSLPFIRPTTTSPRSRSVIRVRPIESPASTS